MTTAAILRNILPDRDPARMYSQASSVSTAYGFPSNFDDLDQATKIAHIKIGVQFMRTLSEDPAVRDLLSTSVREAIERRLEDIDATAIGLRAPGEEVTALRETVTRKDAVIAEQQQDLEEFADTRKQLDDKIEALQKELADVRKHLDEASKNVADATDLAEEADDIVEEGPPPTPPPADWEKDFLSIRAKWQAVFRSERLTPYGYTDADFQKGNKLWLTGPKEDKPDEKIYKWGIAGPSKEPRVIKKSKGRQTQIRSLINAVAERFELIEKVAEIPETSKNVAKQIVLAYKQYFLTKFPTIPKGTRNVYASEKIVHAALFYLFGIDYLLNYALSVDVTMDLAQAYKELQNNDRIVELTDDEGDVIADFKSFEKDYPTLESVLVWWENDAIAATFTPGTYNLKKITEETVIQMPL